MREMRAAGPVSLEEALDLVELYAEVEPAKFERAALRWHARFVAEACGSLLDAQVALAALMRLPAGDDRARELLVELVSRGDRVRA